MHKKATFLTAVASTILSASILASIPAAAGVTSDEAEQLKTTLTPLGAVRAGSADGLIPAWTGGYTDALPGAANGVRADPFASEKPLYSITAANLDKYADTLSEAQKYLLKKYSDYRLDVYPTHRTASAPQYVYDNTFKNATTAKMAGDDPVGTSAGIPFPIPQTGIEVMWNHLLHWSGESWHFTADNYHVDADGRQTLGGRTVGDQQMPYYSTDGSLAKYNNDYWLLRLTTTAPPIKVGEAIVGRVNLVDDKTQTWVYLTGQRRVRKLPHSCCDEPTPASEGEVAFDEVEVWTGRLDRFDWKLIGKKEMLIPYNNNRAVSAPSKDLLGAHFPNPDLIRWELHRVWVVEANLRAGQRDTSPHNRYYVDEDSWTAVMGDRYDARGNLWKGVLSLQGLMPDFPGVIQQGFFVYDFSSGIYSGINIAQTYRKVPRFADSVFTPDAMAAESVR
jgi:hypothetical protein